MPAGALSAHAAGSIQHSRGLEHSALRPPGGRFQYSGGTQGSRASVSPWVEEGVEMGLALFLAVQWLGCHAFTTGDTS